MFTDRLLYMEPAGISVHGMEHIIIHVRLLGDLEYIIIHILAGVFHSVLDLADHTFGWATDGIRITVMDIGAPGVITEVTGMDTVMAIVPDIMRDDAILIKEICIAIKTRVTEIYIIKRKTLNGIKTFQDREIERQQIFLQEIKTMFIQIKMGMSIAKLKTVGRKKIKAVGYPTIKINKEIRQVTWIKTGIKILTGQNR